MTCGECRLQYDVANRPHMVPCDAGGLAACPYSKLPCGSPGDLTEDGCGLSAENRPVVDFYPKWQVLGDAAFNLCDLVFIDEVDRDAFAEKLMMIHAAAPMIQKAIDSEQEAQQAKQSAKQSPRRGAPKKV